MRAKHFVPLLVTALALAGAAGAANLIRVPVDDARIQSTGWTGIGSVTLTAPPFGDWATTEPSAQIVATLSNTRSSPVAVTPPSSGSVSGAGFSFVSTTCGASLGAGQSCDIRVAMTATAQGTYTGTLTVNAGGAKTATLTGSRSAPRYQVAFTPSRLDFVTDAGAPVDRTITMRNTGNTTLANPVIYPYGAQFSATATTCGTSLAPGQTCEATIRFYSASGSNTGSVGEGRYTGYTTPAQFSMTGYARPVIAGMYVTPIYDDLGNIPVGVDVVRDVTLTNTGSNAMTVNAWGTWGPVTLVSSSCPGSLAPGESCTRRYAIRPDAAGPSPANVLVRVHTSRGYMDARWKYVAQ